MEGIVCILSSRRSTDAGHEYRSANQKVRSSHDKVTV